MDASPEQYLDEVGGLIALNVDAHYSDLAGLLPASSLFEEKLLEVADIVYERVRTGLANPDEGAAMVADCVLACMTALHQTICMGAGARGRKPCNRDIAFGSDLVAMLATLFLGSPLLRSAELMVRTALSATGAGVNRKDLLEVALERSLTPLRPIRALPSIFPGEPNLQINSPVSRVSKRRYLKTRVEGKYIAAQLRATGNTKNVELTSDWADPMVYDPGTQVDDLVEGAICRTTWMVVFVTGGRRGTGETLRLAAQLLIPVLVLRRPSKRPLADRHRGQMSIRVERTYTTSEEAARHAIEFRETYGAQIAARHRQLEEFAARGAGVEEVHDAVLSLDPALFETSLLPRLAAIFYTSDPVYWFQAPNGVRAEIQRLTTSPNRANTPPPTRSVSWEAMTEALSREQKSTRELLKAGEIAGWTWLVMQKLYDERQKRLSRETASTSHAMKAYDHTDWALLHAEVFGS